MFFLYSIPIFHERSKDANNKNKDLKAKIYYMALKTMLYYTYPSFPSIKLRIEDTNDIAALFEHKNDIKLDVCRQLQKMLLSCTGKFYCRLQGASFYYKY